MEGREKRSANGTEEQLKEGASVSRGEAGEPAANFEHAAADFGDPTAEHAALIETAGVLDDTDRRVVRVWGERARRMISGLVSNDLAPLDRGRAVYSFLLTPKGRPLADVRVLPAGGPAEEDEDEELWLDTPAACLENLLDHLRRYLPPIYARFEIHATVRRLGVVGPGADRVVVRAASRLGWPQPPDSSTPSPPSPLNDLADVPPLASVEPPVPAEGADAAGLPRLVRREEREGPGWDLYLPASDVPTVWRALEEAGRKEGGRAVGRAAWEVFRVERGVPAYGTEIDLEVLPQETGQEARAVSVDKGCYTGQEVVARIHYRGKVNRLLRGLEFETPPDGATPESPAAGPPPLPSPGTELYRAGRAVGRVTTAVHSPRLGPIGLGYVRREVSPGDRVAISSDGPEAVRIVALPFTER